ncbi:MAG: transporter, partial [Gammaproteobacteria bacterium]|nr:transporter [Gammaproteobacteria bacterium]
WFVIQDDKNPMSKNKNHTSPSFKELLHNVAKIIRQPQPWLLAAYGLLMFTPTLTLGASWGAGFLMAAYHLSLTKAGAMISLIFIGWAIGCPLFGLISDMISLRKPPLYIASVGGTICLFIMIYVHLPSTYLLGALMLFFGIFSGAFLSSFAIARELQPTRATGAALGFMNMAQSLGGAMLPPIVGLILDLLWNGTFQDGSRVYLLRDYQYALLILPLEMLCAGALLYFIKETHCKEAV